MTRTAVIFVGLTWLAGIVTGIVMARFPNLVPLPVPTFTVPLMVGLLVDIAVRPAAESGRLAPVTMNERAIGVIGGAVLGLGAAALFGA